MKKIIYIVFATLFLYSCSSAKYKGLKNGLYAEIETTKGNILLELYSDLTPMTVANFVSLAEGTNNKVTDSVKGKPYFNGLTFHRVVPNFVIQGGDPLANGRGGPGYRFGSEFPKDSTGNLIYKHDDVGILSMANGSPTTNGSQFFITHRAIPHLNEKHTVFGKTIVNSLELESLRKQYKDSAALKKAIDSVRMSVVNKIAAKDTIKAINVIRIGSEAKNFKAGEVFDNEFANFNKKQKEKIEAEKAAETARYSQYLEDKEKFLSKLNESKATKTGTGLRILKLKKTKGKKVVDNKPITTNFTLYTADGKKIQSTKDPGAKPFVFQLDDKKRPMISGFKEGVLLMREGEKARLFIPYSIGFGPNKYGPFPAKSDLVFEIEILKVGK